MVLVSSISNFFSNKISHANKWMRKKIPTCSNSALEHFEYDINHTLKFTTDFIPTLLIHLLVPVKVRLRLIQRLGCDLPIGDLPICDLPNM